MKTESDLRKPLVQPESDKEESIKPVSFFALFKFSDSTDKMLMALGSIAAMAGGAAMPFFMVFFS